MKTTQVTIRRAEPQDVMLILALIRELAEYEKLSQEVVATAERLRESLFSDHPFAEVVIAELDGASVGFALFFHSYSTFLAQAGLFLEDIYVRPFARGRGIGRALLVHLARLAVERGCGRMEWSALDWNEPSITFYKYLGAKPMDDWTLFRLTGESLAQLAQE